MPGMTDRLEQGAREAIRRLRAAMTMAAAGDMSAIKALYSHRDDATGFYGWGGYEKGWEQISRRWDWAAGRFKGGDVTYHPLSAVITGELAYTTDLETWRVRLEGMDTRTEWTNRVTHVFRLEDGQWRLVHRHGNRLEPQYEPGPRLR